MIGEIYLQRHFLEQYDYDYNTDFLSELLGNMRCVKTGGVGMGGTAHEWVFKKDNLLIGIDRYSHGHGPKYKVYRLAKVTTHRP